MGLGLQELRTRIKHAWQKATTWKQPSLLSQAAPPLSPPRPTAALAAAINPKIEALKQEPRLFDIIGRQVNPDHLKLGLATILESSEHGSLVVSLFAACNADPKIQHADGSDITVQDLQELLKILKISYVSDEQKLGNIIAQGRLLTQTGEEGRNIAKRRANYTAIHAHYQPLTDPELAPFRDPSKPDAPFTMSARDVLNIIEKLEPHIDDTHGIAKFTIALLTVEEITIPKVFVPESD